MSWDNPGPTVEGEAAKREQAAREQAARELADRAELDQALAAIHTADGKRSLVDFLLRTNRITAMWTNAVAAHANPYLRKIVAPPVTDDASLAAALHEVGHVLAPPCSGTKPHLSVRQADMRTGNCLACEVDAWRHAMRLCRFSEAMFTTLRTSLGTYRGTASWDASSRELEFLTSPAAFAEHRRTHDRRDRQRRFEREVERDTLDSQRRWRLLYE